MKIGKAVVTGGSGFIGSHLVHTLLDRGVDVCVVSRYNDPVKNERLADVWTKIRFVEADLRSRDDLDRMMKGRPDCVFHLAAFNHVGQSFSRVEECFDVNAKGTANVLDVVNGNARVVYVSSSEVYGDQETVPWREDMAPNPQSPYAITKYAGELHARMHQRLGFPVQIVRPFNTYGPAQAEKAVIPHFIKRSLDGVPILTNFGRQTREFNYVSDVVAGIVASGESDVVHEGPINIASGEETSIKDLLALINGLCGGRSQIRLGAVPYRPNEIWRMKADTSRARKLLGWERKVSFSEGIRRTVEWFRARASGA